MLEKQFKITSETGLHARVSSQLVREASSFTSKVSLSVGDTTVDFKSIMGVMSLGVYKGEIIKVTCDGVDEEEAMNHLTFMISELKLGRDY